MFKIYIEFALSLSSMYKWLMIIGSIYIMYYNVYCNIIHICLSVINTLLTSIRDSLVSMLQDFKNFSSLFKGLYKSHEHNSSSSPL